MQFLFDPFRLGRGGEGGGQIPYSRRKPDEEAKKRRMDRELQEKQELVMSMDKEVEEWEMNKQRERELKERKRGRDQDPMLGTPGGSLDGDGGQKRRKLKARKLKYAKVMEDWGEEDDEEPNGGQHSMVLPPPLVIGGSGEVTKPVVGKRKNVISSSITDYFSPKPKRSRMDRWDGGDWSEEEWFSSATQQYGEDQGQSGELIERMGCSSLRIQGWWSSAWMSPLMSG